MRKPVYPEQGMLYDIAMMEAQQLYDEWLKEQKNMYRKRKGIKLFAVRSNNLDKEE